jgi:hypothetical protein
LSVWLGFSAFKSNCAFSSFSLVDIYQWCDTKAKPRTCGKIMSRDPAPLTVCCCCSWRRTTAERVNCLRREGRPVRDLDSTTICQLCALQCLDLWSDHNLSGSVCCLIAVASEFDMRPAALQGPVCSIHVLLACYTDF